MNAATRSGVLEGVPLFQRLTRTHRELIAGAMRVRDFVSGEMLLRQGDPGDAIMVVVEGGVSVRLNRSGGMVELAAVGPGAVLGEMALVTGAPRNADAVATGRGRVLVLGALEFHALTAEIPELLDLLTEVVAERLGRAAQDGLADKVLAGYRVVRAVGRGGMAVVYEAVRLADGARVALKMMSHLFARDSAAIARFDHEADLLGKFQHEGITRYHGRFSAYGTLFIVMDFVDGVSLEDVLAAGGPLPTGETRRAFGSIVAALGHVHRHGVVHGDLKPANVLVDAGGALRLTDFGISRRLRDIAADDSRRASGTPHYMAPEQFRGDAPSIAADLYALGVILAELITGRPPVEAPTLGALVAAKRAFDSASFARAHAGDDDDFRAAMARLLAPSREFRVLDMDRWSLAAGPISAARVADARAVAAARSGAPPRAPTTYGT